MYNNKILNYSIEYIRLLLYKKFLILYSNFFFKKMSCTVY